MSPERSMVLPTPRFPQYDLGDIMDEDMEGIWPYSPEGSFQEGVRNAITLGVGLYFGIVITVMVGKAMRR